MAFTWSGWIGKDMWSLVLVFNRLSFRVNQDFSPRYRTFVQETFGSVEDLPDQLGKRE